MKRFVWLLIAGALMTPTIPYVVAQGDSPAAAIAAREEAEERYRRLNSALEELQGKQTALDKSIAGIKEQLGQLRDDGAKADAGKASQADLKKLSDRIDDLDQKREADKKLILEKLQKLGELISNLKAPATVVTPPSPVARGTNNSGDQEKGFYYTVEKDDNYMKIAKKYQDNGIKVTWQQIKEANPQIDPGKMFIGQKVFIPQPAAKP